MIIECQIVDNCKKGLGYNVVPPPHIGLFPPSKSDLSYTGLEELFNEPKTKKSKDKSNEVEPESVKKGSDAPIIEDLVLDDEEKKVKKKEVKHSINQINFVKATTDNNPRERVKNDEQSKQNNHRERGNQRNWNGMMSHRLGSKWEMFNKSCYECGRNHVPQATITVNAARSITVVHPKRTMNAVNQESYFSKQIHSFVQRPNQKLTALKNSYANKKVKTVWVKKVSTAKPKAAVNAAKVKAKHKAVKGKRGNVVKASACWVWKPKHNVLDYVSRHSSASITLKKYDYVDARGRSKNSVLFTDTECIVLSPDFKLIDKNQILLRVPRQNNMYNIDLKNIVPIGGLTYLFAKAIEDKSKLWHKRLGHFNFKTINKLVSGNLVRGLPSKIFKNDQSYVACQKGKQYRASFKTKVENSISTSLHLLHMDLFRPTFVKSLNKKMYCLVVTDDYSRFTWADFYNLDSTFQVNPIPTTKIHKDHPLEQVIKDLHSAPQTRIMTKNLEEQGLVGTIIPRTDHKDLQNCLFACFLSKLEPKKAQAHEKPSPVQPT
nr:putative ribonuclease H-like domain-containing protein [Tanacetum cinerariifolium]